jgi:hypothetical protein
MNVSWKQHGEEDNLSNGFFQTETNITEEFRDIPQSLETNAATDYSRPLPCTITSCSSFASLTLNSMLQNTCF